MNPQLTAIVVHDLKNKLGVLEGQLATLTADLDQQQALQAHASCVALREKMIAFLTLYKATEQGLSPRIEAVNPEDFLKELIRNHSNPRPELKLMMNRDAIPAIAFFDEHLLGLALDAALQNATRFAKSSIEVACRKNAGEIVFTVRDDGPGLGATEEQTSTGLGMALCEAIAQAHVNGDKHGSTHLNTLADGGALFTIRLP